MKPRKPLFMWIRKHRLLVRLKKVNKQYQDEIARIQSIRESLPPALMRMHCTYKLDSMEAEIDELFDELAKIDPKTTTFRHRDVPY